MVHERKLLAIAIEILEKLDIKDTEQISVDTNRYEDGGRSLDITIDFKPKELSKNEKG